MWIFLFKGLSQYPIHIETGGRAPPGQLSYAVCMKLDLPDDLLRRAEMSAGEMRLALAVQFYAEHRINYSDACHLAGVPAEILNRALAERDLSVVAYPEIPSWRHRRAG